MNGQLFSGIDNAAVILITLAVLALVTILGAASRRTPSSGLVGAAKNVWWLLRWGPSVITDLTDRLQHLEDSLEDTVSTHVDVWLSENLDVSDAVEAELDNKLSDINWKDHIRVEVEAEVRSNY